MQVEERQPPADEQKNGNCDQIRFLFLYILDGGMHGRKRNEWL
jgi:hypothetical protein